MVLPNVAVGDPHAAAHNAEREAINELQSEISGRLSESELTATIEAVAGGVGGAGSLNELADVDMTGIMDGDTLVWDVGSGMMVPVEGPTPTAIVTETTTATWATNAPNGLIDKLGTENGAYLNPVDRRQVKITSTQVALAWGGEPKVVFDHNSATHVHTLDDTITNWFKFDFGDDSSITPSRFGIQPRSGYTGIRNFRLEGSTDNATWDVLFTSAPGEGPASGAWWSAPVTTTQEYRYLQIIGYSAGHMMLAEVEFWGTHLRRDRPRLYLDYDATGLVDGAVLTYDLASRKWVPRLPGA